MMQVFISHSRKDMSLVQIVKNALQVLSFNSIIYEELPPELKYGSDLDNIKNLMDQSEIVFLFITRNVSVSQHTTVWVQYENHLAAIGKKPLVVFQRIAEQPGFPIIYFTDVISIGDGAVDLLRIQQVSKAFQSGYPVARGLGGAAIGAIFGPIGAIAGGLIGLATTPESPLNNVPTIRCPNCNKTYRYWGLSGSSFYCPNCLINLTYTADGSQ